MKQITKTPILYPTPTQLLQQEGEACRASAENTPARFSITGLPGVIARIMAEPWFTYFDCRSSDNTLTKSNGFTLVELMMVVAIVAVLAIMATVSYSSHINRARMTSEISAIQDIARSIKTYEILTGKLPLNLAAIGMDQQRDKWGNLYVYQPIQSARRGEVRRDRFNNPVNTDYDLYSKGPDGRTQMEFNAKYARDDIVRANNGDYVGIAADY